MEILSCLRVIHSELFFPKCCECIINPQPGKLSTWHTALSVRAYILPDRGKIWWQREFQSESMRLTGSVKSFPIPYYFASKTIILASKKPEFFPQCSLAVVLEAFIGHWLLFLFFTVVFFFFFCLRIIDITWQLINFKLFLEARSSYQPVAKTHNLFKSFSIQLTD